MLTLLACLCLAACATPQERCVASATRDLTTVNALIAETEATIARGYALRREVGTTSRLSFCFEGGDNVGFRYCRKERLETRERPVAVDLQLERRKLNSLRAKRTELELVSQRQVAACG